MARAKTGDNKRMIESYDHRDKQRMNNPPVGLVTPDTDPDPGARKTYAYDPHLDPQLLVGKIDQRRDLGVQCGHFETRSETVAMQPLIATFYQGLDGI